MLDISRLRGLCMRFLEMIMCIIFTRGENDVCKDQYARLSLTPGSPLNNGCTIQVSQPDIPDKVGRSATNASRNIAHCTSTYVIVE